LGNVHVSPQTTIQLTMSSPNFQVRQCSLQTIKNNQCSPNNENTFNKKKILKIEERKKLKLKKKIHKIRGWPNLKNLSFFF
jgi:hypothetical protein